MGIFEKPLLGRVYGPPSLLLFRRFFRHGNLWAAVDLDGRVCDASNERAVRIPVQVTPSAWLRYVGTLDQILSRMNRERTPGFRFDGDCLMPSSRVAMNTWNDQFVNEAQPMDRLFEVITDIRLEDVAVDEVRRRHRDLVSIREKVPFYQCEATVVQLRRGEQQDVDASADFFRACSGKLLVGAPDFMPCNRSSTGLLSLFADVTLVQKARGMEVATFLITEAAARMRF
ncbi:hypothetical protein [Nevskia ramosa]|uniref:hypothetical protein n=1 Tax=Nevskia ramosa TaxID=64002 RepID=UPI00235630A8|nr:hypothetical protein [Nevskia ramosa]